MSKKHFEAIAAILRDAKAEAKHRACVASVACIDQLTDRLGDYFVECNDRFDWDRFVEACNA